MDAKTKNNRPPKRMRSLGSLIALLAALLVIGRLLLPDAVGEQVRRSFAKVLSDHYSGKAVSIQSGRYDPKLGIVLDGIEIRDGDLASSHLPMLRIDRLYVETDWTPQAITSGKAPFTTKRVIAEGVTLNVWQDDARAFPIASLWPAPQLGPACPVVAATNVRINLCLGKSRQITPLDLGSIQFVLNQHTVDGQNTKQMTATIMGGLANKIVLKATQDGTSGQHTIEGQAANLRIDHQLINDELLASLPADYAQKLAALQGLTSSSDVTFRVTGDRQQPVQDWLAKVEVRNTQYNSVTLPFKVENLSATLIGGPSGIQIRKSVCTINGAKIDASGELSGLQWPGPLTLRMNAHDFQITSDIASVLPENLKKINDRVRPQGPVDLAANVRFDGQKWEFSADALLKSIAVNIDSFPYPVQHVTGVVHYRNSIAFAENLTGSVGEANVTCSFEISPKDSGKPLWVNLKADRPIDVDESLISALTPRGQEKSKLEKFVRSLSPGGSVLLHGGRFERTPAGKLSKQLDLEVLDGRLRYEKFPYPLYEVRGRIWVDDAGVKLTHFQAQNHGGAQIQCEGEWRVLADQEGGQLDLAFRGFGVPLDEGLRTALPSAARQTWDTLSPAGILERLEVQVSHHPQDAAPKLSIVAQQWGNPSLARREVSVTPVALPYRLDITRGVVRTDGDSIIISDLDGYHGSSRLAAEGHCLRRSDGRWQLNLNLLTGSRLRPDNELINALPEDIRGSFAKLQLREPISLRGTTQLILPSLEFPAPEFSWDVVLQLEGNRIADAGPVHDIRGEIQIQGNAINGQAIANGNVHLDSLHIHDLQLTSIHGPFLIRDNRLHLGTDSLGKPGNQLPIEGKIFDGNLTLHGQVYLSSGQFNVRSTLSQANVGTLLAELNQAQAGLTGKFGGNVALEGNLGASNLLRGTGNATLTQANLYQLPLLVQFFNQLRLTPAEDVAFTDGSTNFTIDGDLLTLSELQLLGDLVAIHGGGTLNGRREIDLSFNTRVSPQNTWARLVRPLSSQKYTLWTINVRGALSDPKIERRTLEAVGETLERLFPVIERKDSNLESTTSAAAELQSAARRDAYNRNPKASGKW